MAPRSPSIQSFFQPETMTMPRQMSTPMLASHEGVSTEVNATEHRVLHSWEPRDHYEMLQISKLVPGSGRICLVGRVVNFYEQPTPNKMPHAAKGCLKVHLRDDSGIILVRLWYAQVDYQLRLGQLVSLFATHISYVNPVGSTSRTVHTASYATTIFPEHDNSCYVDIQADAIYGALMRTPLGYDSEKQLAGLITLKSFIDGGHEVLDGKVLVFVKSVGGLTTKHGNSLEQVNVNISDDTCDAMLSLCGRSARSAAYWKTSHTILLISNPSFRFAKQPLLCLSPSTHVDVDPCMADAEWLRGFAQRLTAKEVVNVSFPARVFDIDAAAKADERLYFTLSDVDE
ncbi:MAG: hypothetical protein LQ341_001034 [Variospora aurantia]|nr:MAG: hypothetical protein LQ341_001034 [Variospora aurantia]